MSVHKIATVLCFSGHDPSGGAGIQADIETIKSMGAHPASVITALTVQNTRNVSDFKATETDLFIEQVDTILEDISVKAFKIGMTASAEIVQAIHDVLLRYPDIPVVLDPVLAAGGGGALQTDDTLNAIKSKLLPLATIITPNSIEARRLSGNETDLHQCGKLLMDSGCQHVLITGTHEDEQHVNNLWFSEGQHKESFSWDRLPHEYHGSGCTLASAVAALLAQGLSPFTAVYEAQEFTWNSLHAGYQVNQHGQYIPNRFYWTADD